MMLRYSIPWVILAALLVGCQAGTMTRKESVEQQDITHRAKQKADAALEAQRQALAKFRLKLNELEANNRPILVIAATKTAEDIASYKSVVELIYRLTIDSATGKNSADLFISRKLDEGMSVPLRTLEDGVNDALVILNNDLKRITNDLSQGLVEIMKRETIEREVKADTVQLQAELTNVVANYKHRSTDVISSHKLAWNTGERVTSYVTGIAKKNFGQQIKKLASTPFLVVLDGPLPLGEIFAIGRILWVAFDLSKEHKNFYKELDSSLKLQVSNALLEMRSNAEKFADDRVADVDKLNGLLVERSNRGYPLAPSQRTGVSSLRQ